MRGLNAGVQDALQGFGNVLKDYPGLTAIRLNCDSGNDSAASIAQVVQEYTAAGVVVEIEDHSGNGDNVAWYQQMATMFKDNPPRLSRDAKRAGAPTRRQPRRTRSVSSRRSAPPASPTLSAFSRSAGMTSPTSRPSPPRSAPPGCSPRRTSTTASTTRMAPDSTSRARSRAHCSKVCSRPSMNSATLSTASPPTRRA